MIVTLLSVWRAARARSVPFTAETAGYLVLLAAEDLALGPRTADLASLVLTPDGGLCVGGSDAADAVGVEIALRAVLGRLLEVTSSPGPALQRAVTRPPTGDLAAFAAELSKALIPMNRAAARRGVVRLFRETERAIDAGRLGPAPRAPAQAPLTTPRPTSVQETARECTPAPGAVASVTLRIAPLVDPFYAEPEPTRPETTVARRRLGLPHVESDLTDRVPGVGDPHESSPELALPDREELAADDRSQASAAGALPPVVPIRGAAPAEVEPSMPAPNAPFQPYVGMPAQKSDVHDLLVGFRVTESLTEGDVRRELRALADMDATPPPAANDRRR